MGRTRRNRKQKKARNFVTCVECKEVVLLNSWLAKQGMRCNEKLVMAIFDDTGRGVLTKKKIYAGEELINLPLNSTINVTSILTDLDFCSIFLENNTNCLLEYRQAVSFQSLMAFYLVFLKLQGSESKWFVYLESLPKEYTVPYFLPNEIVSYVDKDILDVISKQKDIIQSSFHIFEEILLNNKCLNSQVQNLRKSFNITVYEWAYFTVNTRCVFMDLSKIIDLRNVENTILNMINDNTKISLCPFLDMINHSPHARNETKLMVSKNIENLNIEKLNRDLFSDVTFSIYTKNNFDPYTQVFICYGDSHNLKLITEYGFCLPSKDLDFVTFEFNVVLDFLKSKSVKLSQEQMSFIINHNLNKDLYIDLRGLSFNFYGLLMVVKYYYDKSLDVSRLIYSAAICSNDKLLNELISPLVEEKIESTKISIRKLESYEKGCVLNNCVALMYNYVDVLQKFIKC
ncbi:SET domain-containing protein [Phthorimaea operculella]|nr:SET domain-containing protein [Phthorimaea operculella]